MNLIIDSIMGSGKTTWAIHCMNNHPEKKFIFATPFLQEDARIKSGCPSLNFVEPEGTFSKLSDLKSLVASGNNIATTHALLKQWIPSDADIDHLRRWNYTLILDEALEVIAPVEGLNKGDVEVLKEGMIQVEPSSGRVNWIAENLPQRYQDIQRLAKAGRLYLCRDSQFLNVMPPRIFQAIPNMIVLTFLFEANHLHYYMRIHGLSWRKAYICDGALVFGEADLCAEKKRFVDLLNIYDGKLNDVGNEITALSASFWKSSRHREKQRQVLNHARSFLETLHRAKASQSMWSVFLGKNGAKTNVIKNYATSFVPFNEKATNKYRNRHYLAYLVNIFENPMVASWFGDRGAKVSSDLSALSMMLQWIWRSALRDGKPVYLYLPSKRMRSILTKWLEN